MDSDLYKDPRSVDGALRRGGLDPPAETAGRSTSGGGGSGADGDQQRVIRVFISSTFRDMQVERDELIKHVFPRLRSLCERRGVVWGEVDLRWGITDEQKAEGRVLPICLEEIERCRPYFIGLLGERYGWVPDEISPELLERQSWLRENPDRSVTELEILHGVLDSPEMAGHAFFYLRNPGYVDGLSPEERELFVEGPTADEVERLGAEEAQRRATDRRTKLEALKGRIRDSGFPVREDYRDPRALGELVYRDLAAVIDRRFPEGSQPDPLDGEAALHEAFAAARAGVYIGRPEYFERLDAHARGDGPPLVVTGQSGGGKSALLANWGRAYRAAHPDEVVLLHFIGASPYSADWTAIVGRLLEELRRRLGIDVDVPEGSQGLRQAFANALYAVPACGRVVLVLDALNQLEDRDGAPDLAWLPPVIPPEVRIVLSTLPGRPLDESERRVWPVLEVSPLEEAERERLIDEYLAGSRKALSPSRVRRIAGASQTANPLYLRALLDELRMWGDHDTLEAAIEHYLGASTVDQLYRRILERWERDYDRDRPGLVEDSMSLVWAARRGLEQSELLDLLGQGEEPLPGAFWSPLFLAAEGSLVSRSGLITFSHSYLRTAVGERYLSSADARRTAHLRLAAYFDRRREGTRAVDELPWQLAQAEEWPRLADLLGDPGVLERAWTANASDVRSYWGRIEAGSSIRMPDVYRPVFDDPDVGRGWLVSALLHGAGHLSEALELMGKVADRCRTTGDRARLAGSLGNQANILQAQGRLEEAMELHREQERVCREIGDRFYLQKSLGDQAVILMRQGRHEPAMELLREQEKLCRELGDRSGLSLALGHQAAVILQAGQDLEPAIELLAEQERICRELGDRTGLGLALGNRAFALRERGDLDAGLALFGDALEIARELGDAEGQARNLANQASVLAQMGRADEAVTLAEDAFRLARTHGLGLEERIKAMLDEIRAQAAAPQPDEPAALSVLRQRALAGSLGKQADALHRRGDLHEAMRLFQEQERVARAIKDLEPLHFSLGRQGMILHQWGRSDEAMELLAEQERICRELGDQRGLQASLGNQALIQMARGALQEAMKLLLAQEQICRKLGDQPEGLAASLGNQGGLWAAAGRSDRALPLTEEAYRIAVENGLDGLARRIEPILRRLQP